MAINISKGQYATVWKVEDKGNYAVVRIGTSRKDKRTNEYKNSNWSFVRFVGDAYKKILEYEDTERLRIQIEGGTISLEPYVDSAGETAYPKNPQITIFNFKLPEDTGVMDTPPAVNDSNDDDELPF